jgi:hypothetical protein
MVIDKKMQDEFIIIVCYYVSMYLYDISSN